MSTLSTLYPIERALTVGGLRETVDRCVFACVCRFVWAVCVFVRIFYFWAGREGVWIANVPLTPFVLFIEHTYLITTNPPLQLDHTHTL